MTDTQLSSDLLSRLRQYAKTNHREPWIPVKAVELLALVECTEALLTVSEIAGEAREAWDNDNDSRVGKMLIALAGGCPNYRPDIERIHQSIDSLEAVCQSK